MNPREHVDILKIGSQAPTEILEVCPVCSASAQVIFPRSEFHPNEDSDQIPISDHPQCLLNPSPTWGAIFDK